MTPTPTFPPSTRTRWFQFWFAATDPTMLGFMRIITGLLVLYVHCAYTTDLQNFFGKHAWYGQYYIDRERHELPWAVTPFSGEGVWDDNIYSARLPIQTHRREVWLNYLKALPVQKAARESAMRYPRRLQNENVNKFIGIQSGLEYANGLPLDMTARADRLNAMVDIKLRSKTGLDSVPPLFDTLPQEGANSRKTLREEIEAFDAIVPRDVLQRQYIYDHFIEIPYDSRKALLDFIVELPEDPTEREKWIDYLDYWDMEARKAHWVGSATFSIWFHITDPTEMAIAHAVVLLILVMFTLGLFTRVTSVLTWLACASYIHRSQQVLFGMDTMMNILLIYLMIGNSGGAFSLDRLIARYRAARNSLARSGNIDAPTAAFLARPTPTVATGFATRMIQIHFCFIYMAAGMSKLKGTTWWNTNAYWDTLANPEFTLVYFEWYETMLRWLTHHRAIYAISAQLSVSFTLFMELSLAFLVWTKMRPYIVIGAFLFHLGIATFMGLNMFALLMLTLLLAYLPPNVIRDQLRSAAMAVRVLFQFDGTSATHLRAAALVKAIDVDNRVDLATTAGPIRVQIDGKPSTGADAEGALFANVGLLRWIGFARKIPIVGPKIAALFVPR